MSILFKTYNGKHQLHVLAESWVFTSKAELDEVLSFVDKKEMSKLVIKPVGETIEVEFNGVIIGCRNLGDVKKRFGILAEMKEKYQKTVAIRKEKK